MWQLTSRRRGAGTRAAASTALSSMSFYDFPGKPISYDVSKFDRYGYTRLGWQDMNGSYASEEDAMDSLVPDSELPTSIWIYSV